MLTLKQITDNTDDVIRRLAKKHFDGKKLIEQVIEINSKRKNTQSVLDANLAELNNISKTIGALMKDGKKDEAEAARAKVANMKEGNKQLETDMKEAEEKLITILCTSPKANMQRTTWWKKPGEKCPI